MLMFAWFCVFSVQASSFDSVFEVDFNVEVLDCEGFEESCKGCNAEKMYFAVELTGMMVAGELESTISLLEEVLADLAAYVQGADWYFSLSSEKFCISAKDFSVEPLFEDLLSQTLSLPYSPSPVPLLEDDSDLSQIDFEAVKGSGSNYYIDSVKILFDISATEYFADLVKLESSHKRIQLSQQQGIVKYLGLASTSDPLISCNFSSIVEYDSEPSEITISLITDQKFLLGQWTEATFKSAGCDQVKSPAGINYITELAVSESLMFLVVSGELTLEKFDSYIALPDFAIAPGVLIREVFGKISINDAVCSIVLQGFWQSVNKDFAVELEADENEEYVMHAVLYDGVKVMNVSDYQEIIESFYFDSNPVFPEYAESGITEKLLGILMHDPQFYMEFSPEAFVEVYSVGEIVEFNDTYLELTTERVNSLVNTTGFIQTKALYGLFPLMELQAEEVLLENTMISVDPEGMRFESDLKFVCDNSEICEILSESTTSLTISGTYFPTDFYMSQPLENLTISSINFYSSVLKLYLSPVKIQISSTFDLVVDDSDIVSFDSNLINSQNTALLISEINKSWEKVLGTDSLSIPYLEFTAMVNNWDFNNTITKGICQFTSPSEEWNGVAKVKFDLKNSENCEYFCALDPVPGEIFAKFLSGMSDFDTLISFIDFPAGANLTYKDSYFVSANMIFLGVPSELTGSFLNVPDILNLDFESNGFITAMGNLAASDVTGSLQLDSGSQSQVSAIYAIWGISQSTFMQIDSESLLVLEGEIFKGIYSVTLNLQSQTENFLDSIWTASFSISEEKIEKISEEIVSNLATWVEVGLETLQVSIDNLDKITLQVEESAANLCTNDCAEIESCISDLKFECTSKAMYYECIEYQSTCIVSVVCTEETEYCIDDNCENTVNLCVNFEDACETGEELQCNSYELVKIGIECLKFEFICETEVVQDPACTSGCSYLEEVYEKDLEEYEVLLRAYEEIQVEMAGFYDLESAVLFEIYSIETSFNVTKSGMGPGDVKLEVQLGYFLSGGLTNITVVLPWNYDSDSANASMLTGNLIVLIVKGAENLTDDLMKKTPREIYYEKIQIS